MNPTLTTQYPIHTENEITYNGLMRFHRHGVI